MHVVGGRGGDNVLWGCQSFFSTTTSFASKYLYIFLMSNFILFRPMLHSKLKVVSLTRYVLLLFMLSMTTELTKKTTATTSMTTTKMSALASD